MLHSLEGSDYVQLALGVGGGSILRGCIMVLVLVMSVQAHQEYQSCPAELGPSLGGLVRSCHGCHSSPGCSPKVPLRAWYSDDEMTCGIYSFLSWRLLFESLVSKSELLFKWHLFSDEKCLIHVLLQLLGSQKQWWNHQLAKLWVMESVRLMT